MRKPKLGKKEYNLLSQVLKRYILHFISTLVTQLMVSHHHNKGWHKKLQVPHPPPCVALLNHQPPESLM